MRQSKVGHYIHKTNTIETKKLRHFCSHPRGGVGKGVSPFLPHTHTLTHMTASLRRQHLCFKEGQNGNHMSMKIQKQVNKSD